MQHACVVTLEGHVKPVLAQESEPRVRRCGVWQSVCGTCAGAPQEGHVKPVLARESLNDVWDDLSWPVMAGRVWDMCTGRNVVTPEDRVKPVLAQESLNDV